MHTILVILGGLGLLALVFGVARLLGVPFRNMLPWYLLVWLIGVGINMWVGVVQAGYTVAEELPINLIIFVVPAAIAGLLSRKT
ncbi:hypothetical protein ACTXGQ_01755 [Marinobacter sp. 1Y8]